MIAVSGMFSCRPTSQLGPPPLRPMQVQAESVVQQMEGLAANVALYKGELATTTAEQAALVARVETATVEARWIRDTMNGLLARSVRTR